jgi:ADP-ribose pyrophosphatase
MQIPPFEIEGEEELCGTDFLSLRTAAYRGKSGERRKWDYVTRGGEGQAVTMACRDGQGRYAVIRQPRVPVGGKIVYSFPAGLIEEGKSIEDMVRKEMKEETGYEVEDIKEISPPLPKSAGLTDESTFLVQCELGEAGEQELEGTEDIRVSLMFPREVVQLGESLDPEERLVENDLWAFMSGRLAALESAKRAADRVSGDALGRVRYLAPGPEPGEG